MDLPDPSRAGRPAVVHRDVVLTYAELDARSDGVAAALVGRGVVPGQVVAVALTRGLDWVAVMIGIFKARAAYLPLDPRHPPARLADVVRRAECRIVLGAAEAAFGADGLVWIDVATLPRSGPSLEVWAPGTEDDLAYVMFTSGSTGAPKGAMIRQVGLRNHLAAKRALLDLGPADRVAQTAGTASDMAFWQLLCPLEVGGTAYIIDDEVVRDPRALAAALADGAIAYVDTVPSLLRVFLDQLAGAPLALPSLRCVVVGGEVLPPELCRAWFERFPTVPLVNCYGPTECSDGVTHEWIAAPPAREVVRMSIGRPIDNLRAYVLDPARSELALVVPGEVGELVIAGVGVAAGYINDPDRTERAFVANPFCAEPAFARLYRTGDLVRQLPDGRLDYFGRGDDQVKVRGHRIELGEIEARLSSYPAVAACAVAVRARGGAANSPILVAYLVTTAEPTIDALRAHLAAYLPPHMVPERFVRVDAMPLNANGKLDRRALPDSGALRPALDVSYVEPAPGLEREIAAAWATVLGIDRVGAADGFLALGGDSLATLPAIDLIAARTGLRASFDQVLSLTVAELARALTVVAPSDEPAPLVAGAGAAGRAPLSPSQERYLARVRRDPGYTADHLATAYSLRGKLDIDALGRALDEIVRRHDALRTTFHVAADGAAFQLVHPTIGFALVHRSLRGGDEGDEVRRVRDACREDAARTFDFARGPLLRATLFELDDDRHVLNLVMHHIVSDGWSWGLLARELAALYAAFTAGRPSPLREPRVGYADYAWWTQAWRTSGAADRELAYWRRHLHGATTALAIRTDRPRPEARSCVAEVVRQRYDGDLARELDALSRAAHATPFMTFATAFAMLLARRTGNDDLVFGSVIANRTERETDGVIGCFQNGLLVRAEFAGAPSFLAALERVRRTTLAAYEHQRVSTEMIIDHVFGREHGLIPQVVFALQNAPDDALRLPGIEAERIDSGFHEIRYDFVLEILPHAGRYDAEWSYRTDLFEATTIAGLAAEFEAILGAAIEEFRAKRLERMDV